MLKYIHILYNCTIIVPVHTDILFFQKGNVRICDFGVSIIRQRRKKRGSSSRSLVSKAGEATFIHSSSAVGSPGYMSPELLTLHKALVRVSAYIHSPH